MVKDVPVLWATILGVYYFALILQLAVIANTTMDIIKLAPT
jgi:hypothetical protein